MELIKKGETAILFSALKHNDKTTTLKENLEELTELTVAADLHPIFKLSQKLKVIDSGFLIGAGKRRELLEKVEELKPGYVIFDQNLSGAQTRNLEKFLKLRVLDRSQLILEIFAQRAQSKEGKLQVELAQLMDQMPRMVGAWLGSLSRQRGGGAARGPGEKALEKDRRQAQMRIKMIKDKLKKVEKNRSQGRKERKKRKVPSFALIGYTNSGKSTLLNRLTKSKAETKSQAFMTLDPKTRKLFLPGTAGAVLTDTVGFIRNIPPHLLEAFKATLEESASADVILHVVDVANPKRNEHIKVVDDLIEEFGWGNKPCIYVFNKMDLLDSSPLILPSECERRVKISARTGWNTSELLEKMKETLDDISELRELFFPKGKEHNMYDLSRQSRILEKEESSRGTLCRVKLSSHQQSEWKEFFI